MWLLILAFTSGFLIVFAVNMFLADIASARSQEVRLRLEEELRRRTTKPRQGLAQQKELYETRCQRFRRLSQHMTLQERLELFVDQSGADSTAQRVIFLALAAATTAAVSTTMFLGRRSSESSLRRWGRRCRSFIFRLSGADESSSSASIAHVFDLMSRMLRAGRTDAQAFHSVADEFSRPASEEFGLRVRTAKPGTFVGSGHARARAANRIARDQDLRVGRDGAAANGRKPGRPVGETSRHHSRSISHHRYDACAEGRLQAIILLSLPPFLLAVITLINRPYAEVLFDYPMLLAGMAAFIIFGALWMRRIINFDF